jgi:hypothetical protein
MHYLAEVARSSQLTARSFFFPTTKRVQIHSLKPLPKRLIPLRQNTLLLSFL